MPCILRFSAPDCDIDSIAAELGLPLDSLYYQGQPFSRKQKNKATFTESGFQIAISEAVFEDFSQQVSETIQFIKLHQAALQRLSSIAAELDGSQLLLDFGIATRMFDVGVQVNFFPPELIELAGKLKAGLVLRQYAPCEDIEEYEE